ncbi:hypothetical protein IWX90DRAFT_380644 [Phyllosticta citrichinensis]|uniref:WSC domain-containing protein n=1 Tax=Phyllosticta citrichinensis TaxID=1130410 RepID=A0ABR1XZA3_9PEZI
MLTKSLAALAALSATASAQVDYSKLDYHGHYFRQEWINQPLNVQRLDPILNPGQLSPHVHSFIGAPVISANTSFADTQKASCSQVYVKPDKSVYWMPSLYFQNPKNQSFIRVPEHHRVLYYFNRASDPKTGKQDFNLIEEFPPNFRMIAGDSMLRSPASTKQMQGAVEWFCHGPDSKSSGFPAGFTSCANGLAGSIHFPYCWNGQDFNVSAPQAHMSYPVGDYSDSGACPSTHPHVLPHIFIEFWFDVSSFNGQYGAGDTPWVLSNGDPTGYSFHADFLNGWTPGVLGNAMKTCNIGESGEPLSNCFEVNTDAERNACSQPAVVDEKVDGWLPALPGCNPIQKGPDRATASSGSNGGSQDSHGSMPSASSLTLPASWSSAGCYSDAVSPRSLSGETFAWFGEKMTATGCANHCASKGFSISGVEFGQQCFCSNTLSQSKKVDDAKCGMPCVGAASQTCGGDGTLSVYTKGGKDPLSAAVAAAPAALSPVASYAGSKSSAAPVAPIASSPVANNAGSKNSAAPAVPVASSPAASEDSSAEYASYVEPAATPASSHIASAPVAESPVAATPAAESESESEPASSDAEEHSNSNAEPAYARRHVGGGAIVRM